MHALLLGLLATAEGGRTPRAGVASGSDWVYACIDLDWHSKEAALSATPGFRETAAGGTSQVCGAGRITLGVLTDVQRKIYDRGCPCGPHKTSSAFYGCRDGGGGVDFADKMMSFQVAGAGVAVSRDRHVPNASASLGDDACAEAANKDKCFMNVCTCVICDSGHANAANKDNKWSDFSLDGGSAHAWDEGVALLYPLEEMLGSGTCSTNGETLGATWQSRPRTESTQGETTESTQGKKLFVFTAEMDTASSSPWPLLMGALMGCLGFSVVALKWRGSSASKAGPDKVDGQKSSRRAKENEVMALTGSTAGACRTKIFLYFFYFFLAMVGLCGVAYEASTARYTRGGGAMSGLLSVNSIVPESCPADAAGKARRLVETGLVGAAALRLGGIASLEPSAAHVRVAAAALLVGNAAASAAIRMSPERWVELDSLSCKKTRDSCAEWAANATDVYDLAARCRKCPLRVRLECAAQCTHAAAAAFNDTRHITFTHIPKAAGTSFVKDLKPRRFNQNCYLAMKDDGLLSAVMLRTPESHVRSQFGECYFSRWGHRHTNRRMFPRTGDAEADFNSWVHHFATQRRYPADDFRCIDPREVQARHMSCGSAPNPKANHALKERPNLAVALYLLQDADFVGVADFYQASVCVLQLRRIGFLPYSCTCSNKRANSPDVANVTHGVPHGWSNGLITDPRAFQLVLNYTALDAKLFAAALRRFRSDVAVAERVAGQQLLCADENCQIGEPLGDPKNPPCARVVLSGALSKPAAGSAEETAAKAALFARHPSFADYPPGHD